jgi:hypothetical protein
MAETTPTIKRSEGSVLRADILTAIRKEIDFQTVIAQGMRTGSAPRELVKARLNLLEEYAGLLEDENMCVILKVEREYPPNGRLRL